MLLNLKYNAPKLKKIIVQPHFCIIPFTKIAVKQKEPIFEGCKI